MKSVTRKQHICRDQLRKGFTCARILEKKKKVQVLKKFTWVSFMGSVVRNLRAAKFSSTNSKKMMPVPQTKHPGRPVFDLTCLPAITKQK